MGFFGSLVIALKYFSTISLYCSIIVSPDGATAPVALDKADVVNGVNAVNRESGAVQGETMIEQYSEIVEKYFKAITKEPKKPTKP